LGRWSSKFCKKPRGAIDAKEILAASDDQEA
jgi:hypothetical protein